jgi:hypothetical protein
MRQQNGWIWEDRAMRCVIGPNIPSAALDLVLLAVTFCTLAGCSNLPPSIEPLAKTMDDVASMTEEYGTASISAPVFTAAQDSFKFTLPNVNASTFYADAKQSVQANIADFSQNASIIGFGANVSVDPTKAAAYLAQVAQYNNAAALNAQAQSLVNQKQSLINQNALQQYNLQVQAAQNETDPTKKAQLLAQAGSSLQSQFQAAGPATLPPFPTANSPAPATNIASNASDAAALLSSSQLSAFQSLLNGKTAPTLSDREALFQAAGDNATAAIFQVLGDPSLATAFADKKVLIGVVNVAVNPGWRTRQGYSADVSSLIRYNWQPARLEIVKNFVSDAKYDLGIRKRVAMTYQLPLPSGDADPYELHRSIPADYAVPTQDDNLKRLPLITAVAPMTQSEVEENLSSRRSQAQLALDLSGAFSSAGLSAQASFFDHFAKSLQHDVDAINSTTSVNTYSVNGQMFGFEVGPRLRAVANAYKGSGAATVLERQAFPAMIILGFEDDALRPRIVRNNFGEFRVVEPWIRIGTTVSWHPLSASGARLTEQHRLELVQKLDQGLSSEPEDDTDTVPPDDVEAFLRDVATVPDFEVIEQAGNHLAELNVVLKKHKGLGTDQRLVEMLLAIKDLPAIRRDTINRYAADVAVSIDILRKAYVAPPETNQQGSSGGRVANLPNLFKGVDQSIANARTSEPRDFEARYVALKQHLSTLLASLDNVQPVTGESPKATASPVETIITAVKAILGLSNPPPTGPKSQASAQMQTQIDSAKKDIRSLLRAMDFLKEDAKSASTERDQYASDLRKDARGIMNELFPQSTIRSSSGIHLELAGLRGNSSPAQPLSVAIRNQSGGRGQVLQYRAFSGIYDAPLPVQLIDSSAAKHPIVTSVLTDFQPSVEQAVPIKNQAITVYLIGKDLDALAATIPMVLLSPVSGKPVLAPVTVLDGPTVAPGTSGVATCHVTLDPAYKSPFALQLKEKVGTDTINTPPIWVPRLDGQVSSKVPVIRRLTGPRDDPSSQQIDEQQFFNISPEEIKSKIEEKKPEHSRLDVNVDINKPSH